MADDLKSDGIECRIGRVVGVAASRVTALLDHQCTASPEMGNVVGMPTRVGTVYGIVSRLDVASPGLSAADTDRKLVEIELAGEVAAEDGEIATFQPGTSAYPLLDAAVWLALPAELSKIYAPPEVPTAVIGSLHEDSRIPAYILIDELLAKHFSVLGSTSSGKSCLIAEILGAVLDLAPNGHVILLDPHGEYADAFGERAAVLSPGAGLYFPYWLFNFEELVEVVLGPEPPSDQAKILGAAVVAAKQAHFANAEHVGRGTLDTPLPYRIADVLSWIDGAMGALNPVESLAAYRTVAARITALQNDARYAFVFTTRMRMRDELRAILAQLFRIPVAGKPITILDLAGVPSEIVNVIVSVICRLAFDFALWGGDRIPITIICEEAHRYAPRDGSSGFEGAKRALLRVAKEGRKYGVSLGIVSQRPSDLLPALLSECGTMFAFRMTDQEDQVIVRSAAPESSHGLLNFLPALRTAEAIAVGRGVALPMRIRLVSLPPERRPKSATALFSRAWAEDVDGSQIEEAIWNWRRGIRPQG